MSPFVQEMQALVARAKCLHATERAATLESIEVIGKLDRMRASCAGQDP